MNYIKTKKAVCPPGILKAGGDKCWKSLTNTFNDILLKNKLPEE